MTAEALQCKVISMTENPAASSADAASLLGAVNKAQFQTNLIVRARILELLVVVNTSALASSLWRDKPTSGTTTLAFALVLCVPLAWLYVRRRRNLGGTFPASLWIVAAVLFAAIVVGNLVFHGDAEATSVSLLMAAALLVVGALERSYVLAIVGLVVVPLSFMHGSTDKVVSAIFGMAAIVFVGVAGTRKQLFGRNPR